MLADFRSASPRRPARRAISRRARWGGMMALLAFLLIVVVAAAAFTIDVAYMQMVNSEMQVSLDAASRAGVVALTESSTATAARAEAKRVAALNPVAGRTLKLKDSDIELGSVTRQADGSYKATGAVQTKNIRL